MKKTFLIVSLTGRISGVFALITSLKKYTDWNLILVLQKYSTEEAILIQTHAETLFFGREKVITVDEATGPHLARCIALDSNESDVWCILDDDMEAVEAYTKYDKMADIVYNNKSIGFLSGNWRKSESMIAKMPVPAEDDAILKQNIVYTGGGMMFRQDVAEIIKAIPRVQYLFDNPLWSIYAYVNGYDNYRYVSSVAIHRVCSKGGRRKWLSETNAKKSLPPEQWIRTRRGHGAAGTFDEYLICDSKDITEEAKQLHAKNKKEHGL